MFCFSDWSYAVHKNFKWFSYWADWRYALENMTNC